MTRSNAEYGEAMELAADGFNNCQIARATGIPRSTVRDWRRGHSALRRTDRRPACNRCKAPEHDFDRLPGRSYIYLLGLYLGDGTISRQGHTWRLRISLDTKWPMIVRCCKEAMEAVFAENRVAVFKPNRESNCVVVSVYSNQIVCLFPQHGAGPKHLRRIMLAGWQQELVEGHTEHLIRGLIHSDGCRLINRVRTGDRLYEYGRYNFTNMSDDIRDLFTTACDRLSIDWRYMNRHTVSVARRASVARLDQFVGPKS